MGHWKLWITPLAALDTIWCESVAGGHPKLDLIRSPTTLSMADTTTIHKIRPEQRHVTGQKSSSGTQDCATFEFNKISFEISKGLEDEFCLLHFICAGLKYVGVSTKCEMR